jgi:hypothetical protein
LANNLTKGEKIIAGKTFNDNIELFRDIFEIGKQLALKVTLSVASDRLAV